MIIVLDSGPAGLIIHSRGSVQSQRCNGWLEDMTLAGYSIALPEIIDYELRRELLRGRNTNSVRRLNQLTSLVDYLPITTSVMHRAAELWAIARQRGQPTASDRAIDSDMILAAQAMLWRTAKQDEMVIASANLRHLDRFVPTRLWEDIS